MSAHASTPRRSNLAAWLLLARVVIARAILATVTGLAVWAIILLPFGLSSTVIASGSMRPSVAVGDVVVTRPISENTELLGRVVTAANPAKPGHLLSHRIVADHKNGTYQTKGDANRDPDSTPLPRTAIHGRAFLLVPWVGLPSHWLATGQPIPVVITAIGLIALAAAARDPEAEAEAEAETDAEGADVATGAARHRAGTPRRAFAAGGLVLAILGAGAALLPAGLARSAADFNATSQNGGNNIRIDQCLTTTMTFSFETDANCWEGQTAMQSAARNTTGWHNGTAAFSGVATFSGGGDSSLLIRPGGINLSGKTTMTAVVARDPNSAGGSGTPQAHIFYENYTPGNGWYFCTTNSNYVTMTNTGTAYNLTWTLPADDGTGNGCNRSQARAVGIQFWTNSGASGTDKVYVDDFKIT